MAQCPRKRAFVFEKCREGLSRGGIIEPKDLVFVGVFTEGWANHTEIVHVHFWRDAKDTITGCYEADPISFDTVDRDSLLR